MKKLIALGLCGSAFAALAAFDVTRLSTVDVLAPTAITGAATNSTEFSISAFKGRCEIVLNSTVANGRRINAALWGRSSTDDAWKLINEVNDAATNRVVVTLPFIGDYVTPCLKLCVTPSVDATVSAFVLGNR